MVSSRRSFLFGSSVALALVAAPAIVRVASLMVIPRPFCTEDELLQALRNFGLAAARPALIVQPDGIIVDPSLPPVPLLCQDFKTMTAREQMEARRLKKVVSYQEWLDLPSPAEERLTHCPVFLRFS